MQISIFFVNRVCYIWNSLPSIVVEVPV